MNFSHLFNSFVAILNEMSPYILLGFVLAGVLHVFVRPATLSRHLAGSGLKPVVKAALLGIPLPLCSCSVLPTAVSLRRNGASRAASTSFLIATPQTGVDSIAATYSLLGLPFAILRPLAALAGAVAGGLAVGRFDSKADPAACNAADTSRAVDAPAEEAGRKGFLGKTVAALRYGLFDMVAHIGRWLVIGLLVATLITVFVPESFFTALGEYPVLAMLATVAVAVPMYVCATGSIPIALSLMLKGMSPGVAFVLLMAGPAANFASVMVLSRSHGKRATAIYVATVVATAMAFGLAMDYLLPQGWFELPARISSAGSCHTPAGIFPTLCSVLLVALLIRAAIMGHRHSHKHNIEYQTMKEEYKIKGMMCQHCRARVEKELSAVEGVETVEVDLSKGLATVSGHVSRDKIIDTIRLAGYEYVEE